MITSQLSFLVDMTQRKCRLADQRGQSSTMIGINESFHKHVKQYVKVLKSYKINAKLSDDGLFLHLTW